MRTKSGGPGIPYKQPLLQERGGAMPGQGFLAEHTLAMNGDATLGYTRGEQKVSSPPVDAFFVG